MDQSFENWDVSEDRLAGFHPSGDSIVISDSDEDVVENSVTAASNRRAIVVESNDEDTDSGTSTPEQDFEKRFNRVVQRKIKIVDSGESADDSQEEYHTICHLHNSDSDKENFADSISYSPIESNDNKKKDIHNSTKEKIKGLKHNYSNKSLVNNSHKQNDEIIHEISDYKISDHEISDYKISDYEISDHEAQKMEAFHDVATIVHDTDSNSERYSESEVALSIAKQEIGVGNIDPLVAQKRAVLICKLEQLKNQLTKTKLLLSQGNIEILPDKGERLHKSIREQETEIEKLTLELEKTPLIQSLNIQENKVSKKSHLAKKESLPIKDEPDHSDDSDHSDYSYLDINNIPMKPTTSPELRQLGEKAQATRDRELALTVERLQDLHGSLVARPTENEKAKDPRGLQVQLMPHQQHALAWLLWREQQRPAGGVLADDMGLGKTLTMISLIMTTLIQKDSLDESDDSDDDEWNNDHKHLYHKGGTLVVCPASLLFQWNNEVQNRCKRGLLTVEIYHGSNRESVPKRLSKNDIVITTYNILSREHKTRSTLYKINWKRVILDEAHVIRNHKSQASLAVCELKANKRWALTGTPIQNKAMDLYSILKFLKCSPFDDLRVWKRWVDNKNAAGNQRLATVMKSLMLRRTKQELIEKGDLESLPDKLIEEVIVKLDPQEQLVYEKVLIYSRTLFAQFLVQKAEKEHMSNLYSGNDGLAYLSNPTQNKLMAMHADVKTHQILVLLLRLRQLCCHPPLIHAMLDQDDIRHNEITDTENVDPDLLSHMSNMSLNEIDKEGKKEVDIDSRIIENLLTAENPIFRDDRISSKMRTLLNMVKEILQKSEDKLIIVSQWTALLNVIASHLSSIKGATFSKFTGNVAIKDRQSIIDSFNSRNSDPRILLLSLTAGGVGLNLVGANHLLLFDIHWNPQLETQAQDRIYRFGQKKNVHVYKFICLNTIEERIKGLQDRKLEIASNVLSGDKNNSATKLTLNDLKSLFGF
ncbi:transcription termination factor 2 isoform X2 [Camponotus floridanus]|uniref:transcription termination factor 2 isoform X2 n=1 Tax=Camponotus floridanus TaxID=104421 RepID=UPI000DC6C396|nr:transcription termination factor 2 isoform X2 [Camponotus floridanus]